MKWLFKFLLMICCLHLVVSDLVFSSSSPAKDCVCACVVPCGDVCCCEEGAPPEFGANNNLNLQSLVSCRPQEQTVSSLVVPQKDLPKPVFNLCMDYSWEFLILIEEVPHKNPDCFLISPPPKKTSIA